MVYQSVIRVFIPLLICAAFLINGLGLTSSSARAQSNGTVELAFLVDGSGSIFSSDFTTMINGIATALEDDQCVPHDGTLELTIIQFASGARIEVDKAQINSTADAVNVAGIVRNMNQLNGSTNYADAFDLAIATASFSRDRQVINIATDGGPNSPTSTAHIAAVQRAINAGFDEIDAEGIGLTVNQTSIVHASDGSGFNPIETLRDEVVYPQPGILVTQSGAFPDRGGWVRLVDDIQEFADTVCEKFQVTVTGEGGPTPGPTPTRAPVQVPEPITIVLFGTGLAGLAGYARHRRKQGKE